MNSSTDLSVASSGELTPNLQVTADPEILMEAVISIQGTHHHLKRRIRRSMLSLNLLGTLQKVVGPSTTHIHIVAEGCLRNIVQLDANIRHHVKLHGKAKAEDVIVNTRQVSRSSFSEARVLKTVKVSNSVDDLSSGEAHGASINWDDEDISVLSTALSHIDDLSISAVLDNPVVSNAATAVPALDTLRRVYVHADNHRSRFVFLPASATDWRAIQHVYADRRVASVSARSPSGAKIYVNSPQELRDSDEIYVVFCYSI